MNATVYVANILPDRAARIGQDLMQSGTVHSALGFGAWGIKPTTVVNFGDISKDLLALFLQDVFTVCPDEEALYVVTDGAGATVYRQPGSNIPCMI